MSRRPSSLVPRLSSLRPGFSLVELIVAIVILAIGVLGLASTAAVVMRQIAGGAQQTQAAAVAQARFETLRGMSCTQYGVLPYTGVATQSQGVSESWAVMTLAGTVNGSAPGLDMVDTIFYDANGKRQTRVFRSVRTC
ncbi:MAG TPA: prepilin-type N-terminal cleavage/methylation domain-containing protein [Gemmatimonadaceae bacterium]|nr:prepilin-type N-terminal cleavage/methylation domain-containing protein [Gemmatimonadaceae bacterium]